MRSLSQADVSRVVGSLLSAASATGDRDALYCRWLAAAEPAAELALILRGGALRAFRSDAGHWSPLSLPPVAPEARPASPVIRDLSRDRLDALDDLLVALGMPHVLVIPAGRRDGAVVLLARSAPPFTEGERDDAISRVEWLGTLLDGAVATRGGDRRDDVALELASLLDLLRDLGRPLGADAAAAAAARSLRAMLGAEAGAVIARAAPGETPIVAAWPDGSAWERVAERLFEGAEVRQVAVAAGAEIDDEGEGLAWIAPDLGRPGSAAYPSVRIVLGFRGAPPEPSQRVSEFVRSALVQALDRHTAQREREEARLRVALESLPLGVMLLGEGARVRLSNRAADALLERIGAPSAPGDPLAAIGVADIAGLMRHALSEGGASREVLLPDLGRTLALQLLPSGAEGVEAGASRDVLLLLEDVTEERQRTRELARAEKLSALGVLVSGIVHEINNPLSTVLGYAEMLARDPSASQRVDWIGKLMAEGERCRRIVGNMLHLVRDREPTRVPVALDELAERALSLVAHPFHTRRIEASLETLPGTPVVSGEPDGLLQVFINLLTNAMHALEAWDGPREVVVTVGPSAAGGAEIVVRDSGPGIDAATIDRVFDPFFTTKPEGKGTGLGLGLVASCVERHGGKIGVESGPGEGAEFRIVLPEGRADATGHPERTPRGLEGRRILIADDEPEVAALLAELFEGAGATVDVVGDAESAVARAGACGYDAILADLTMPRTAPEELLDQLDAAQPGAASRVIFCSGAGPASHAGLRGRPCLAKPFEFPAVLDRVCETIAAADEAPAEGGESSDR